MQGFAILAFVVIVGAAILEPFRRKIGGLGGGSEKAIVGGLWLLAAILVAIFLAER